MRLQCFLPLPLYRPQNDIKLMDGGSGVRSIFICTESCRYEIFLFRISFRSSSIAYVYFCSGNDEAVVFDMIQSRLKLGVRWGRRRTEGGLVGCTGLLYLKYFVAVGS